MGHAVDPVLLVCVHQHFGIRSRAKAVAETLQLRPQRLEVVDFTIKGGPDGAVFILDWLVTGLQINDAQPPDAQSGEPVDEEAFAVGAAMAQRIGHSLCRVTASVGRSAIDKAGYSADGGVLVPFGFTCFAANTVKPELIGGVRRPTQVGSGDPQTSSSRVAQHDHIHAAHCPALEFAPTRRHLARRCRPSTPGHDHDVG